MISPIDVYDRARFTELRLLAELLDVDVSKYSMERLPSILFDRLSYYGSNSISYFARGKKGADYLKIVKDVANKVGIDAPIRTVHQGEKLIIEKLFKDAWSKLSKSEQEQLIKQSKQTFGSSTGLIGGSISIAAGHGISIFAASQIGLLSIIQGSAASIFPSLISAPLAGTIASIAPVIGWVVGGIWLAISLGGPAYRKTVRAVLLTSYIRQLILFRLGIGIIGNNGAGKHAAVNKIFGITSTSTQKPGTIESIEVYPLDGDHLELTNARIVIFPGLTELINAEKKHKEYPYINEIGIFIHILDYNRGVLADDVRLHKYLISKKKVVKTIFNKIDLAKDPSIIEKNIRDYAKKLELNPRQCRKIALHSPEGDIDIDTGVDKLRDWIEEPIRNSGKDPHLFFANVK
jgi:uncharacterized protein YaaW (UPF0174 family)/GTP-binding protein EngB required for normal cell division